MKGFAGQARPKSPQERCVAKAIGPAILLCLDFIYDVPGMHPACQTAHSCLQMGKRRGGKLAGVWLNPSRNGAMPPQRTPAHACADGVCKAQQPVHSLPLFMIGSGCQMAPLHLALGNK